MNLENLKQRPKEDGLIEVIVNRVTGNYVEFIAKTIEREEMDI